jgi:hypothetical protein
MPTIYLSQPQITRKVATCSLQVLEESYLEVCKGKGQFDKAVSGKCCSMKAKGQTVI